MIALPSTDTALPPSSVLPPDQRPASADESIVDLRFRALIGEDSWARLPPAVQKRFSSGCRRELRWSTWGGRSKRGFRTSARSSQPLPG